MPSGGCFSFAEDDGIIETMVDLGEPVEKGMVLARIHSTGRTGVVPQEIKSKMSGTLGARHFPGLVKAGDWGRQDRHAAEQLLVCFAPLSLQPSRSNKSRKRSGSCGEACNSLQLFSHSRRYSAIGMPVRPGQRLSAPSASMQSGARSYSARMVRDIAWANGLMAGISISPRCSANHAAGSRVRP